MYPTIMAIHNISPETVNCELLCRNGRGRGQPGARKAVASGQWSVVSKVTPPPPTCRCRRGRRRNIINVEAEPVEAQRAVPLGRQGKDYVEQPPPAVLGAARWQPGPRGGLTPPLQNPVVPEAGYHLCHRREGLVPRTLKPILALREQLKARAQEVAPEEAVPYKERQTALKWMLVTCFGYLGYKNARFGRIEAHEAVTAHGRDKLLTAKEISEAAGYTVLHGLTDCLWLQKPPCPPFSKGGSKSPFGKGGPRGICSFSRQSLRLPETSWGRRNGSRRNWESYAKKFPRPPGSSWPWKGSTAGSVSCPPSRTRSGRWPRAISGSSQTAPSRCGAWPAAAGTRRPSCAGPRKPCWPSWPRP